MLVSSFLFLNFIFSSFPEKSIELNYYNLNINLKKVYTNISYQNNVLMVSYDFIFYNKISDETLYIYDFIQATFEEYRNLFFRFSNTYIYFYDDLTLYRTNFIGSKNYDPYYFNETANSLATNKEIAYLYSELATLYNSCSSNLDCLDMVDNEKQFYKKILKKIIKVTKKLNKN